MVLATTRQCEYCSDLLKPGQQRWCSRHCQREAGLEAGYAPTPTIPSPPSPPGAPPPSLPPGGEQGQPDTPHAPGGYGDAPSLPPAPAGDAQEAPGAPEGTPIPSGSPEAPEPPVAARRCAGPGCRKVLKGQQERWCSRACQQAARRAGNSLARQPRPAKPPQGVDSLGIIPVDPQAEEADDASYSQLSANATSVIDVLVSGGARVVSVTFSIDGNPWVLVPG
jgi:hypothetical protein